MFRKQWTNIAKEFKTYDQRVLFAALNEPGVGGAMFSLITSVCRQLAVLLPAAYLLARTGRLCLLYTSRCV